MIRQLAKEICPPLLRRALTKVAARRKPQGEGAQDLGVYWSAEMSALLETWGANDVWNEVQLLLANCEGRVLDVGCGTGKVMSILKTFEKMEVHGCDISDFLIGKARERGISPERLTVCDATEMPYENGHFSYSYSIGSLEHFTEEGIAKFLKETQRVSTHGSYHMIPVSRDGSNHGWINRQQSYFNNGDPWWLERFRNTYKSVIVVNSGWSDDESLGRWFLCSNG